MKCLTFLLSWDDEDGMLQTFLDETTQAGCKIIGYSRDSATITVECPNDLATATALSFIEDGECELDA